MWLPEVTEHTLKLTCQGIGLDYQRIELLRFGTSAIYRLHGTDLVARVARKEKDKSEISREMAICRWLNEQEFLAIDPADYISTEPIEVEGMLISFWHFVDIKDEPVSIEEFADLLKRFHQISSDYPGKLHRWNPMKLVARDLHALRAAHTLTQEDLSMLWEWRDYLDEQLFNVKTKLGEGPLHGDAHVGNCVKTDRGLMLLDFDLVCYGPREWDLTPAVLGPRRFNEPKENYWRFAEAYGYDVTKWPYFKLIALARELLTTTWRLQIEAVTSAKDEGQRRLQYWRQEKNPPHWQRF
jgi:Ser/Thr protein kinase RdoA (MazF antagonist)